MKTVIYFISLFLLFSINSINANNILRPAQKLNIDSLYLDPDWILIIEANEWMMSKFVVSTVNPSSINFQNKASFLSSMNLSEAEYDTKHFNARAAALRLIEKYNLSKGNDCPICSESNEQVIERAKEIIDYYRNTPSANYSLSNIGPGGGGSVTCCPMSFYICCSFCAATIEAFPVYLLCCYLCACSYCCPDICPSN